MNRLPLRKKKPGKRKTGRSIKEILEFSWPPSLRNMVQIGVATGILGIIVVLLIIQVLSSNLPSLEQLEAYSPRLITKVLGRNGEVLKELFTEKRIQVPLDSVSVHMKNAVLSTEDRKFYSHCGIDLAGIARAAAVNTASLSKKQGASTLTQQLARNLYLHLRQTVKRKIREIITAIMIERTYAKDEILQMYMTQMYFGHGVYGVQSASQKYFGINASELSAPQAATLTALLKAPAHYSPISHPAKAQQRRNLVLGNMYQLGYLDRDQYKEAIDTPIELAQDSVSNDLGTAPYFTEWIRQKLEKLEEEYGFDYYRDGLTVQTTLDSGIQAIAETVIDTHLATFQTEFNTRFQENGLQQWLVRTYRDSLIKDSILVPDDSTVSPERISALEDSIRLLAKKCMKDSVVVDSILRTDFVVQLAFIAMDPNTGDVLAMVGGRDFNKYKFNRAVQSLRQPGSVFKPFVYTTAIDNGIYANHRILNMVQPVKMSDGTWWRPENYSIDDRGSYVSLRQALRSSMNNVTVRMVSGDDQLIPIREVIRYANHMGIRTKLDPVPALALGSCGVIPIDIVTAYTVFATGGMRADPRAITSIEDRNGAEILSFESERTSVLSPETSAIMTDLLSDVVNRGTGGRSRWMYKFYAPAAGKTGTTNNFTDAWFVGFTPEIVAGVWIGFDDPQKSLGPHQNGSKVALPVWAGFMKELYASEGVEWTEFDLPVGVDKINICTDSGEMAGPYCPNIVEEVFRRGDEPAIPCTMHRIRSRSGR